MCRRSDENGVLDLVVQLLVASIELLLNITLDFAN